MSQVGGDREQLLSRAFVGLADTLVDDYDIIDLLDRLVGYSLELLAADAAGILLADSQCTLRVVASSNEDAEVMELLQVEADEGPCVECFRTGAPVSVGIWPTRPRGGQGSSPRWRGGGRSGRCTRCRCGCAVRRSGR